MIYPPWCCSKADIVVTMIGAGTSSHRELFPIIIYQRLALWHLDLSCWVPDVSSPIITSTGVFFLRRVPARFIHSDLPLRTSSFRPVDILTTTLFYIADRNRRWTAAYRGSFVGTLNKATPLSFLGRIDSVCSFVRGIFVCAQWVYKYESTTSICVHALPP